MLASFVVDAISRTGHLGILVLMALESACIPIPSEIIMPFAGYLSSTGRFGLLAVSVTGALGCNLGSTLAYAVGAYGGRAAVLRWGRYVLIERDDLARVDRFFERYGAWAVFAGRLLPVVRTFISLPAGIARMPMWKFQLCSFLGSLPWCFALAYVGFLLGEAWDKSPLLHASMWYLDVAVVCLLVLGIGFHIRHAIRAYGDRSR